MVHREGYDDPKDYTWEPKANLHPELIEQYEAEMRDNMSEAIDGGMGLSGVGGSLPDASTGSYHGKGWDVCETRSQVCFGSLWVAPCARHTGYSAMP